MEEEEHVPTPGYDESLDLSADIRTGSILQSEEVKSLKTNGVSEEVTLEVVEDSAFKATLQTQLRLAYTPLEQWYLRISIEKAHQLDEPDVTAQPAVSSILDDAFFLLKKVLGRVISTGNVSVLAEMCSNIRIIMERDFAQVLKRRMEGVFTMLGTNQGRADEKERREKEALSLYIVSLVDRCWDIVEGLGQVYLNNLDLASDYITRLVSEFLQQPFIEQNYYLEREAKEAQTSLKSVQNLEDRFRSVLKVGISF